VLLEIGLGWRFRTEAGDVNVEVALAADAERFAARTPRLALRYGAITPAPAPWHAGMALCEALAPIVASNVDAVLAGIERGAAPGVRADAVAPRRARCRAARVAPRRLGRRFDPLVRRRRAPSLRAARSVDRGSLRRAANAARGGCEDVRGRAAHAARSRRGLRRRARRSRLLREHRRPL